MSVFELSLEKQIKRIEIISSFFSDHSGMKLEINHRKEKEKLITWSILLRIHWVNDEIKEKIKKYLETNGNEDTTLRSLWNAAKVVLRGKFMVIQAFLKKKKKKERYQINNLNYYLKELENLSQQKEGNNRDQRGNK